MCVTTYAFTTVQVKMQSESAARVIGERLLGIPPLSESKRIPIIGPHIVEIRVQSVRNMLAQGKWKDAVRVMVYMREDIERGAISLWITEQSQDVLMKLINGVIFCCLEERNVSEHLGAIENLVSNIQ